MAADHLGDCWQGIDNNIFFNKSKTLAATHKTNMFELDDIWTPSQNIVQFTTEVLFEPTQDRVCPVIPAFSAY